MTTSGITRRRFGVALTAAATGIALPAVWTGRAQASDAIREGIQIGALGALRTTLPAAGKPYDLMFDVKDFRDSTSALLAIDQGELEISNTTTQHLIRAISENIPVKWLCGWGGGYNVLVAQKGLTLKQNDSAALQSLVAARKRVFGDAPEADQGPSAEQMMAEFQIGEEEAAPLAEGKRITFTQKIIKMTVSQRIKLAMMGNKEARTLLQAGVSRGYEEFVGRVATGRKKSRDQINAIAQGRVWAGTDAQRQGLDAKLGDFDEAVGAAARRAHLSTYAA